MPRELKLSKKNQEQLYDELIYALNRISRFRQVFSEVLPDGEYKLLTDAEKNLAKFLDRVKM